MNKNISLYFSIFLIVAAVSLRIARHFGYIDLPANFAPITAIALFAAVFLPKKLSLIVPIIAMFIADIFIGFYNPAVMFSVYLSFALISVIGLYLKKDYRVSNMIGGSLAGSILFFLITNFAVWAWAGYYPQTISGLIDCYIMAIPFFKNTLFGDLFYVTILFGSYELVQYFIKSYNNKKILAQN